MKRFFPSRSEPDLEDREPKLIELDEADADEVFDALGSETARMVLLELHNEPRPASELADTTDTTVQNVQYHLTKLTAADLIEEVDTWYSESGSEMTVYAPANDSLVLFAGDEPESSLRRLLEQLVGPLAALAIGAIAIALAVSGSDEPPQTGSVNTSAPSDIGSATADPLVTAIAFVAGGLFVLALLIVSERVLAGD